MKLKLKQSIKDIIIIIMNQYFILLTDINNKGINFKGSCLCLYFIVNGDLIGRELGPGFVIPQLFCNAGKKLSLFAIGLAVRGGRGAGGGGHLLVQDCNTMSFFHVGSPRG